MITSTIKSNESNPNHDFPKLMINKGNFVGDGEGKKVIILALSEDDNSFVGPIVYSDNTSVWPIGYMSYDWTGFEDYYGEITLKSK